MNYADIAPGDVVTSEAGHVGVVIRRWEQVEFAHTPLERVRRRLVVNDGRYVMPWDWGVVVSVEPRQMGMWE